MKIITRAVACCVSCCFMALLFSIFHFSERYVKEEELLAPTAVAAQVDAEKPNNILKRVIDPNLILKPELSEGNAQDFGAFATMRTYFNYLTKHSPINDVGSCGFVSLIQLLSYYDNFFDDSVIPETYDASADYATQTAAMCDSPGTLRQQYDSFQYGTYQSFVSATAGKNFQSYLTKLNAEIAGQFKNSIGCWDFQRLLNRLYGPGRATVTEYEVKGDVNDHNIQVEYDSYIRECIEDGIPVIVHISNGQNGGGHSVVAYDFDANNIYANYGWGSFDTHKKLLNQDYTTVYRVAKIDFTNLGHSHTDNYSVGKIKYCQCGEHEHQSTYYCFTDIEKHVVNCYCGYCNITPHSCSSGGRLRPCVHCGTEVDTWTTPFLGVY